MDQWEIGDRPGEADSHHDASERLDRRQLTREARRQLWHDLIEVRTAPDETEARAPQEDRKPGKNEPSKKDDADGGDDADADGEDKSDEKQPKRRFAFLRNHPFLSIGILVLLIAAIVGGILWYLHARHFENSDDAFIDSRQFSVASKVSGYVTEVYVTDNQNVSTGDLLFRIDPRDYQIAIDQQQASVAQAQSQIGNIDAQVEAQKAQVDVADAQVQQSDAALVFAKQEEARAADLVTRGAGTLQNEQQRRSSLQQAQADSARARANVVAAEKQVGSLVAQRKSAEANLVAANAQLEQAKLNLSYTEVRASQPGRVTRLTGAVGQFAQAGSALSMFVPNRIWVTANFKETQITDMRPGQTVDLSIDAYPGRKITGHVDSIQAGSGTAFSLLPAENATGNYVKVVQRVPVKIVFDDVPTDITLGPGMSVVPTVRVR